MCVLLYRVKGQHMLDTMEDGTEMVTPDPYPDISLPSEVSEKQRQQEEKSVSEDVRAEGTGWKEVNSCPTCFQLHNRSLG